MKELYCVLIVTIVGLIGCAIMAGCNVVEPGDFSHVSAEMAAKKPDIATLGCLENGVCCYRVRESSIGTCVATRVTIVVEPGELADETKGSPAYGGEVSSPALERRVPFGAFTEPSKIGGR